MLTAMSDCIEWTGGKEKDGYGRRWHQGRQRRAHRVAFFEAYGYWPNICRHTCDNRPCVNIDHLRDGTHADNARDRMERGRDRHPHGEKHCRAKLTEIDVRQIRWLAQIGCIQRDIAEAYGVSKTTVNSIVRRT